MGNSFAIERLTDEQASQAFPLVQASNPDIELPAWQEFVRFHNSQAPPLHAGVLAMRDGENYICGVSVFRVEHDLRNGPAFSIQLFVAADMLNSLSMVRALLDAAEVSASKLGCATVQVRLSENQTVMAAHLRNLLFASDGHLSFRMVQAARLS